MKPFTFVSGILPAAVVACVVGGCSTSTADGSALDEQRIMSKPDTTEGHSCQLPQGQYTVHYVADPANTANCMTFQDMATTVGSDGGAEAPPGPGCTKEYDAATCTTTNHCTTNENGVSTSATTVHTVNGSTDTGTAEFEISGPTPMKCKYTVSMTKN